MNYRLNDSIVRVLWQYVSGDEITGESWNGQALCVRFNVRFDDKLRLMAGFLDSLSCWSSL